MTIGSAFKLDFNNLEALRAQLDKAQGGGDQIETLDPKKIGELQGLLGLLPTGQLDALTREAIQKLLEQFNVQGGGNGPDAANGTGGIPDLGLLIELAKTGRDRKGQDLGPNAAPLVGAARPAGAVPARAFGDVAGGGLIRSPSGISQAQGALGLGRGAGAPEAGTAGAAPFKTADLKGNDSAEKIRNFFVGKGLTPAQADGIIGNLKHESGLDPTRHQVGGPAFGLAQWEGSRKTDLQNFAARRGTSAGDLGTQLEFMWKELQGPERGALEALKRAATPAEAARIFSERYERPGIPHMAQRIAYAEASARTFA